MSHSGSSVTWDTGGEIHLTFACKTDAFCPSLLVASFLNNKTQSCSISLSSGRQLYSVLCGGGKEYSHRLYSALRGGTHIHCTVHCGGGVLTSTVQCTAGGYSHPLHSTLQGSTHTHCTVHCGGVLTPTVQCTAGGTHTHCTVHCSSLILRPQLLGVPSIL